MINSVSQGAYNNFGLQIKTSDGDTINLSMYDNKEFAMSNEGGNSTMSLSHSTGYKFEYSGNGLSDQDLKEIDEAMKAIRPTLEEYLKKVEESDTMFGGSPLGKISETLKSMLPEPKDENMENAIKSNTLDTFDSLLKNFDENDKILKSAKELFDQMFAKLDSQIRGFYA